MCIRDRFAVGQKADAALVGVDPVPVAIAVAPRTAPQRRIPVSYTHLRAHETVLDLVCRLLLEKKKDTLHTSTLIDTHTHANIKTTHLPVYNLAV